jgi:hypothetical protein
MMMSACIPLLIWPLVPGSDDVEPDPETDCLHEERPACESGTTGPACDIPCLPGTPCDYDLICHSWGDTYGISVYGAYLFRYDPSWPDWLLQELPGMFVTQHPRSFGLSLDLAPTDLELRPAPLFRASAGKLTLYRFTQSYRGFPVFGPDRLVTVVANPQGAVAMRGAIVDRRVPYLHAEHPASKSLAASSALLHAARFTGIPAADLDLAHIFLVAVPRARAIGWAATVVHGPREVAQVVVEADPAPPDLLPLLHFSRSQSEGLADTVQVTVRAEDLGSEITLGDPFTGAGVDAVDTSEIFDMTPLLGSTHGDQFRLGTERVLAYDASTVNTATDLLMLPVVSADAPSFLASPGTTAFRAQSHFAFVSNALARTDLLMAGKWESLLPLSGSESVIPLGEFTPRVLALTDVSSSVACPGAPACAGVLTFPFKDPEVVPPEWQQPFDTQPFEVIAAMYLRSSNNIALVAHEVGHVVDNFAHPGTIDQGVHCTGSPGCTASCMEDTTDEATPLRETFANLASIWLGHELTAVGRSPSNCSYLPDVSTGVNRLPHNESCRSDDDPFPRLLRDDDPACPSDHVCDKPSSPGFIHDQENDVFVPTGACEDGGAEGGYKVDSFFQTLWEALHAQTCSETPPYTCQPLTALAQAGSGGDVQGGALLYALQLNSMTYRAFAADMATYIACNFGEDAYFEFNQVACHHGLRDCDAGVPLSCEVCGDNQRQGGEACDGADLGGSTCEALGFAGGALSCSGSCAFDTSMCRTSASTGDDAVPTGDPDPGPEPTTNGDATGTTSVTAEPATTTNGASSGPGDEGCACRSPTRSTLGSAWLLAGGLLPRRRRSRQSRPWAALVCGALALPGAGCSLRDGPGAASMTDTEASSGEPTSTTGGDVGAASSSTGPEALTRLYGVFHTDDYTDGVKWEQPPFDEMNMLLALWGNVLIEPDSTLQFEYYACGGPPVVQSFTWEPDGEGIRVVPPNGEGKPFKFAASEVWEVSIKPGEICGEILLGGHQVGAEEPHNPSTYVAGHLCTTNVSPTACEFEFKWCDGPPAPPMCE